VDGAGDDPPQGGDLDELVGQASANQLERAGNAAGELLTWLTVLGAFPSCKPVVLEARPDMGHAFGAWQLQGGHP
jgi:hypothetical protein